MKTRTRFAPSPTGYMHIGNLRTALYAYLLAKHDGGDFILRIEDTDQERYVEGAVEIIYRSLKNAGLIHDEGPDIDKGYGPYIQSERRGIYKEYAEKLVELGGAYYCFCDEERLTTLREEQKAKKETPRYDGHCKNLSKEEVEKRLAAGEPYVIRQVIPEGGKTSFDDVVFGHIEIDNSELDEGVLLKSDGLPTYNFANVVDDHLMNITHVIRGSEYLTSTPKYNLLYQSFGWDLPVYIHCSPIVKEGGVKYSKRNGDASYEDFINMGYLNDAIINYIALLGWSPRDDQEIFSMDGLIKAFSIEGISKSPAVFDIKKLNWMNGEYIRSMSQDEFFEKALPYLKESIKTEGADVRLLSDLLQNRLEKFTDIPEAVDFVDSLCEHDETIYISKKMKTTPEISLDVLKKIKPVLEALTDWSEDGINGKLNELIEEMGVKNGVVLFPLRAAVSGKKVTPGGGTEIALIIGKEETLKRIDTEIEFLSNL